MKRVILLLVALVMLAQSAFAEGMRRLPKDAQEMLGRWEVKGLNIRWLNQRSSFGHEYDGMEVEVRDDMTITFYLDGGEKTYDWEYEIGYYGFDGDDGTRYHFDIYEYTELLIYDNDAAYDRDITGVILEHPKVETAAVQAALPVAPAGDFEYWEGEDGGICITEYYGSMTELAVPAEINGQPVTEIGDHAFWANESIVRVEVPEGVKRIGRMAFERCTQLYSVIIPEGVEEIGQAAFRSCEAMGVVTLPGSVHTIGSEAFAYCKNLTKVELQEGLLIIGERAFDRCEGLETIALPQSVETIGERAFAFCAALKSVTLPKNLKSMGRSVFEDCYELATAIVPEGGALTYVNGMIIDGQNKTLMAYLNGAGEKHVVVPEGVLHIAPGAFSYCNSFESIELPEGLLSIGDGAFTSTRIKEIAFPASLERMGNVFGHANSLTQITVAQGNETFKAVDGLLYNTKEQALVLAAAGAMNGHVAIEEGTKSIGSSVFMNSGVTGVTLPGSLRTIGENAFYRTPLEAIKLPEGLETIETAAFGECAQLPELSLPDSVTFVGERAFAGCEELASVTLSSGLTTIVDGLFNGCGALTEIEIPEGVVSIGSRAFGNASLQRVTLPASLEEIHMEAFFKCDGLAATVQQGTYAAQFCSENGVKMAGEAAVYAFACEEIDGGLRITGLVGETTSLSIPRVIDGKTVLEIAADAFRGNAQITRVSVGNTVTKIGAHAFAECTALKEFEMREHIDTISEGMLMGCTNLEVVRVYQPKTISARAFAGCVKLSDVRHLEFLKSIEMSAFADCQSLTTLELPRNVQIHASAFTGCTQLSISTRTGGETARFCNENGIALKLEELPARYFRYTVMEDGVRIDGFAEHAWEVVIPRFIEGRQVTQIAAGAFDGEMMQALHLPEGLLSIGEGAFMNVYDLKQVNIPASVRTIEASAFAFCEDLSKVILHEGLETIGERAFAWCGKLAQPKIPQSVQNMGRDVFYLPGNE